MATDDIISSDDLDFIQRAEGLQKAFGKLRKAKALILEARADIAAVLGKAPPATKTKAKAVKAAPHIEFGVDLPNSLTANEKTILSELKKGPKKKKELVKATGLKDSAVARATRSLAARKLATSTGKTVAQIWKAK
jgi:hypothetical protein